MPEGLKITEVPELDIPDREYIKYSDAVHIDVEKFKDFIELLGTRKSSGDPVGANEFAKLLVATGYVREMKLNATTASCWALGFVRGFEFAKRG